MSVAESLLQRFGGTEFPAAPDTTHKSLAGLDPARDQLLALFAAAINSELAAAWTVAVAGNAKLASSSPVQDTFPGRPLEHTLTQRKSGWPLLCLHRDGRGEFVEHTLERDKLTQPWKLHWIVGPVDIIDQRKILDAGQALAKIVRLVIRKRGHKAYQDGALQFFGDTSSLASVELTGYAGPDQAGFAGDQSSTLFWAVEMDIVTTELSDYLDGSEESALEALDMTVGVGGGEGLTPALLLGQSDADPNS